MKLYFCKVYYLYFSVVFSFYFQRFSCFFQETSGELFWNVGESRVE